MRKPGEDNRSSREHYKPARAYLAGYNYTTGYLTKVIGRGELLKAENYAKEIVATVDPEQSYYHRGRWERAVEFLRVLTLHQSSQNSIETRGAGIDNMLETSSAIDPKSLPTDNLEEI